MHPSLAHVVYVVVGVVALVRRYRHSAASFCPIHHPDRRVPLGSTTALHQFGIDYKSIPVLDHHVATKRQLCFMATAFARQSRVRVGCRLMCVIAPLFAVEVDRRISRIVRRRRSVVVRL